jgi:cytochrome c553
MRAGREFAPQTGSLPLQILLDRVRARKIDIIVVYKVDRLTRSLADFAKLVELFDAHEGHLAETVCSACHKIEAYSQGPGPNPNAPNFVDISLMPSMSELAIKVFLRSPHPSMPNIILSSEEIDSIAAYIKSLNKK